MKRFFFVFLLVPVFLMGNVFDLFEKNLENSSSYWSSMEEFKEAQLNYKRYTNFWNPEISVSMGETGITITKDGVSDFSISPVVNFVNIYGFELGLSFPISVNTDDWSFKFDGTQLSVSRGLKTEYTVERLVAEANYLSGKYSLKSTKNSVFIQTVQDIFDWYYYTKKIEILSQRLRVLNEKLSKTKDEDEKKEVEKQILSAEQSLRSAEYKLQTIQTNGMDEEVYQKTREFLESVTLPATTLDYREDLKALELQKKAEEIEKKTWFLPYLPDLTFSLNYDFKDSEWSIGIGFQMTLWDFGERKLEAEKREFQLVSLEYQEKVRNIENSLKQVLVNIVNFESQLKQKEIELEDLEENFRTNDQLFKKGFLSEEDYTLSKLDYMEETLEKENLENSLILEKLKYISTLGYDLEKFLKEGDQN